MSGGIFLMRGDELVEMRESPYEAEDVLQALIAKFPSLLAGDQYADDTPRRWLLVGRETSLPTTMTLPDAGRSTTCFSTRTRCRHSSR